jgi:hypothetical protein
MAASGIEISFFIIALEDLLMFVSEQPRRLRRSALRSACHHAGMPGSLTFKRSCFKIPTHHDPKIGNLNGKGGSVLHCL